MPTNCRRRRDPIASTLQRIYDRVRRQPKRVVFAEGEEEQVMRAAVSYVNQKLGTAILVGRDDVIKENARNAGVDLDKRGIEIINARLSRKNGVYADYLYERMQRKGFLFRDCQRLINNDRNHFAACMVALGDADALVTGVTRNYSTALDDVRRVIDAKPGHRVIGVSIALCRGRTVIVADTAVHDMPNAEQLADIAEEVAGFARRMGYEPRIAMLAYSTFGHPPGERSERVQEAVKILEKRRVDFEYRRRDGGRRRAQPAADGAVSVLPPVGTGQCAGHAGVPLGVDLDQDAAGTRRLDGDRPADRRPQQAGADRLAQRQGFRHRQHGGDRGLQRRGVIASTRGRSGVSAFAASSAAISAPAFARRG